MAIEPFNWNCPHCGRAQTATEVNFSDSGHGLSVGENEWGKISLRSIAVACSNDECKKIVLHVDVLPQTFSNGAWRIDREAEAFFSQRLIPESSAKSQPDYIPIPLREDYTEACRIRDLSPKASATLSRRCIQGMIRDFCKIAKARLVDEIDALREAVLGGTAPSGVTIESVEAIDHVRGIGNIGAHMEKDIDLIIPVDPDEAQLLIELIEMLFEEWYVARHKRQERLAAIAATAEGKKTAIATGRQVNTQKALPKPA